MKQRITKIQNFWTIGLALYLKICSIDIWCLEAVICRNLSTHRCLSSKSVWTHGGLQDKPYAAEFYPPSLAKIHVFLVCWIDLVESETFMLIFQSHVSAAKLIFLWSFDIYVSPKSSGLQVDIVLCLKWSFAWGVRTLSPWFNSAYVQRTLSSG